MKYTIVGLLLTTAFLGTLLTYFTALWGAATTWDPAQGQVYLAQCFIAIAMLVAIAAAVDRWCFKDR